MLYLTTCELVGGYPVAAEQWLELVLAGMEQVLALREQGKIVQHVCFAGRQAGAILWDVESNNELQTLLAALPFWPFMEWEIVPVITTEQSIESLKTALAAVRGNG